PGGGAAASCSKTVAASCWLRPRPAFCGRDVARPTRPAPRGARKPRRRERMPRWRTASSMNLPNAPEPGFLEGISVLEVAGGPAAAFCGRTLADFGAAVLKVEPPGGDALRWTG